MVIAPDLRGRGASIPAGIVERHSFGEHAADIQAILDRLEVSRAVIGGSSFGAAVATAFTLRHPERVDALILVASAFGALRDPMGEGNLDTYGDLADRIADEGLEAVAASEAARTGSTRPLQRWTQHDEASLIAWLRAVPMYRPFERKDDLRRIAVPALVVSGGDAIHTPELSAAYAGALPNATLVDTLEEALGSFLDDFRGSRWLG
jgi:pimeloyl-ACP methyl ester carboxylesterase